MMTNLQKNNLSRAKKQSGVVLFITLVALVIMLIASVALIRSTDTNLLIAGSLAYKRDVVNQAERSLPVIRARFEAGALSSSAAKETDSLANNYYATIQASNAKGIPNILLDTDGFDTTFPNNNITNAAAGITIRYVIDRMCLATGAVSTGKCTVSKAGTDDGCNVGTCETKLPGPDMPVYRISIRATGPKNTESFIQSTFTI